jgi:hypothetical protein
MYVCTYMYGYFAGWQQFRSIDYAALFPTMQQPAFVFDGRNILDHAALRAIGFQVYVWGRLLICVSCAGIYLSAALMCLCVYIHEATRL